MTDTTSRICVKNLPKYVDDNRLRSMFSEKGEITDVKLMRTKDGKSRQFAFIGFRTEREAQEAIRYFNKSFLNTHKIACELKKHSTGSPEGNSHLKIFSTLENENYIPSHGIASVTFKDLRILPSEKIADFPDTTSMHNLADSSTILSKDLDISRCDETSSSSLDSRINENIFLHENKELWDVNSGMSPPVNDNVICAARHQTRMSHFCLDEASAKIVKGLSPLQCSSTCPTLLLNENDESSTLVR